MLIKVPEVFAALDLRLWAVIYFGMKKCATSKGAGRGVWIGEIFYRHQVPTGHYFLKLATPYFIPVAV